MIAPQSIEAEQALLGSLLIDMIEGDPEKDYLTASDQHRVDLTVASRGTGRWGR